jgi:hypothetical protein
MHPELAYIVMRPAFMAAEHFEADFAVGTPRAEHIAFYRRAFGATLWRPPRDYPGLTAKLACVGAEYRPTRQHIESRYPFFKSDPAERESLFGPPVSAASGTPRIPQVLPETPYAAERFAAEDRLACWA